MKNVEATVGADFDGVKEWGERLASPDYALPSHLKERRFGIDPEVRHLPVRELIMLSQQRGGSNPMQSDLNESIAGRNMQSEPIVGKMSREGLGAYIAVVNHIWGANHSIEEYQPDSCGEYLLVLAGHSRVRAVQLIDDKLEERYRQIGDCSEGPSVVRCKVFPDPTPHEILSIQLDENLHEKPGAERSAVAMVELFQFGIRTGEWSSKAEFVRKSGGKFSVSALSSALRFNDLPEIIRNEVFIRRFGYGQAVELGKIARIKSEHRLRELGKNEQDLTEAERRQLTEDHERFCYVEMQTIKASKLSVKRCRERYAEMAQTFLPSDVDEDQGLLFMVDPEEEYRERRRRELRNARDAVQRAVAVPVGDAVGAARLARSVFGEQGTDQLDMLTAYVREYDGGVRS